MSLFIQSNIASLSAQNNLGRAQGTLQGTFARLSSGYRINSAADDAAGLGISQSMSAQVRSFSVAERNANDAISMAQVADGVADQLHNQLQRMRELAVQGSNGTLSSSDRANVQTEFAALLSNFDQMASNAKYNGIDLMSTAATTVSFQVGINNTTNDRIDIAFSEVSTSSLSLSTTDISTDTGAQGAIDTIDAAISSLSTTREGYGSAINRFNYVVSNLQTQGTNLGAALSRIRDTDVAAETANMARQNVLSQAGVAVLAQANQAPQLALSLLRG